MALAPAIAPAPLIEVSRLRIAITGAPHTGKTTMAYELASRLGGRPRVLSTEHRHLEWSAASDAVAAAMSAPGWSGIVEGVDVPRVLRKMLRADPTRRPIDRLIILETVHGAPLTARQAGLGQSVLTVLSGPVDQPGSPRVIDALRALGVVIEFPHHQGATS